MSSKKGLRNTNLENMHLPDRINYGYKAVIKMMLVSGLLSILVIGVLFVNMNNYVNKVNAADIAVKHCRINVNSAARNIREMALNNDTSSYDAYEETVLGLLDDIDSELKTLKETNIISQELYTEYEAALSDWGTKGKSIMEELKSGQDEKAINDIINDCTPSLNKLVGIAQKIDAMTVEKSDEAVKKTMLFAGIGIGIIIVCLILAILSAEKLGKRVLKTIVDPIHEIENVAHELTEGNLHTTLEYHSEDELGRLADSMRKSISILAEYVDEIDNAMSHFSAGDFSVQPRIEWKGDFIGISDSFFAFEKSMAGTVTGIKHVSEEVSSGAEQVAFSSNDLAEGATNQAAVVEELTATVAGVSEQVRENSVVAKEISEKVGGLGNAIDESNGKMQQMVESMDEINHASKEIDKIIATINEIANQTNLLALNASIEAARAGEAGKGFAVVANQVNILADQSAQAAQESAALIETSVRAVEKGMIIAEETAMKLQEVAEGSRIITDEVANVAVALETQTEEIMQINAGIEQINDVVQSNSATSEESAAASQEMSGEADNLREMIGKFKIAKFD